MNAIVAELTNLANGSAAAGDDLAAKICRDAIVEVKRLREEIQYALDRLSVRADQEPGLRVLIDEATNYGDYFPSSELRRRKDQIHEINHHFGEFQKFTETVIEDAKRLQAEKQAAIALLLNPERVVWGYSPAHEVKGYFLDGVYAGETLDDVIQKAAEAAGGE